jgi:hypothetical protein
MPASAGISNIAFPSQLIPLMSGARMDPDAPLYLHVLRSCERNYRVTVCMTEKPSKAGLPM